MPSLTHVANGIATVVGELGRADPDDVSDADAAAEFMEEAGVEPEGRRVGAAADVDEAPGPVELWQDAMTKDAPRASNTAGRGPTNHLIEQIL